jgi:uncharacterized delta-60 repeat protein
MRPHVRNWLALTTLLAAVATGCAAILGFEETKLGPSSGEAGIPDEEAGIPPDEGGAPDGDSGVPEAGLTMVPASPIVRRGATTDVTVTVVRGSSTTTSITLRLSSLPVGVTATTMTLAEGATTGTLKLTAAASATLGPRNITLTADGTSLPPVEIPLLVADAAGALDTTFDNDGVALDPSTGDGATFFAVGAQADRRIVAVGSGAPPTAGWLIRRYAIDGVPDTAFNGLASAAAAGLAGEARALAVDAAGNVVIVGSSTPDPDAPLAPRQLTVVRLKPSGALDGTFGGGIVRPLVAESPGGSSGLSVAVQADGAVLVAGSSRDLVGGESGVLARLKPNGTRDGSFNGGASFAVAGARFVGVSTDGAGVLVAGSTTKGALPSYIVSRRTASGANDPTFGAGGFATFGNTFGANASARLPDGSVAIVGDVQPGGGAYTAGVANGSGGAQFVRSFGSAAGAGFFGVAVQSDGRIIAAGHTAVVDGEARVARILTTGSPDTSFSDGGAAVLEPAGSANGVEVTLFGAVVQPDGRILVAGNRSNAGAAIYRLWP